MGSSVLLVTAGSHFTRSPPLGLLSLAAVLRPAGFRPELFDLGVQPGLLPGLLRRAESPDVLWIGFSSFTPNLESVTRVAADVRRHRPDLPLILGGVHATALPAETLLSGPWDAVCVGEGERCVVEVSRRLQEGHALGGIASLLLRATPNAPCEPGFADDLSVLPMAAWDLIDVGDYSGTPWQWVKRGRRIATISTTRGCPHHCSFCAGRTVGGHRVRHRPVEAVVEELRWLSKVQGVDEFHVLDDNFNGDLDHAKRLLDAVLSAGIRAHWKTPNGIRADGWDLEFIRLARAAGFYQVGFGIESADEGVLRRNHKNLDLDVTARGISAWREAGITTFGFFILGLPGETLQSARRTRNFAVRSMLDNAHTSCAVPYPGSPLFAQLRRSGWTPPPWDEFKHVSPFPTCELSSAEVTRLLRTFYLAFYASPRRAVRLAVEIARSGPQSFGALARSYFFGRIG